MRWAFVILAAGLSFPASARPSWVKLAQDLGLKEIRSCQACHGDQPIPGVNARGQWLINERARRRVSDIDLRWLKDYPAKK